MFGYVRICKPELRIKEFEYYKAVYCSLCKQLGKQYGPVARLTLNYDFTFLGLLSISLGGEEQTFCRKRCTCNPLKKCNYLCEKQNLDFPSATAMIMLYYKLLDNIDDEKGFKKLGCVLVRPFFSSARKKAMKAYPKVDELFKRYIKEQKRIEANNCRDIDLAAEPTADCMAELFRILAKDEMSARCLHRLGYTIGRYIYILDAAVDFDEDVKKRRYNPFAAKDELDLDLVKTQLNICIAEAANAYELLDIKIGKNILDNIIYLGLKETYIKELKQ
jgi:hypothetical protein